MSKAAITTEEEAATLVAALSPEACSAVCICAQHMRQRASLLHTCEVPCTEADVARLSAETRRVAAPYADGSQ